MGDIKIKSSGGIADAIKKAAAMAAEKGVAIKAKQKITAKPLKKKDKGRSLTGDRS